LSTINLKLIVIKIQHFVLRRHLKRVHGEVHKRYTEQVSSACDSDGRVQPTMAAFLHSTDRKPSAARQRTVTNSLVKNLIVKCGLAVSIVDNNNFQAFVADLDPSVSVPCRQTVTQTLLPQQLTTMKEKLQGILDKTTDVSLTTDIWSDRQLTLF